MRLISSAHLHARFRGLVDILKNKNMTCLQNWIIAMAMAGNNTGVSGYTTLTESPSAIQALMKVLSIKAYFHLESCLVNYDSV